MVETGFKGRVTLQAATAQAKMFTWHAIVAKYKNSDA